MATYEHYYVNDTESEEGDHEVHREGCYWLKIAVKTTYLGYYDDCQPAVSKAKHDHYRTSNGCKHCSTLCHTS